MYFDILIDDYHLICSILEILGSFPKIFFWALGLEWDALVLSFLAADRQEQIESCYVCKCPSFKTEENE